MSWVVTVTENPSTVNVASSFVQVSSVDSTFAIIDDLDDTKKLMFSVGGEATASTLTLTVPALTASRTLNLPLITGTDTLPAIGIAQTWTGQQTFVAPVLGIPASGVLTNCTGTAAGLTAGNVTTNANLTGPITSAGNATSIASQTGTGTKFVVDNTPTLITPVLGAATGTSLVLSGALTSNTLTPGRITTAGTSGILQDFAGLVIVGTPSATAPNTGTNGPGLLPGIITQGADGSASLTTTVTFGNGAAKTTGHIGYPCQGTAATPGATILGDQVEISLRGYDAANFTGDQAAIRLKSTETWSATTRATQIQFITTPSTTINAVIAGIVDHNAVLAWGGSNNGIGTYLTNTLAPKVQLLGTTQNAAGMAQSAWIASVAAPTHIFAKSRSTTVGTPGVITTADSLGTISFQGDDGTNFVEGASIVAISEGTIATGQVPGRMRFLTHNASGTSTQAAYIDSSQIFVLSSTTNAPSTFVTGGTITPRLQILGTTTGTISSLHACYTANAVGPSIYLAKSRGTTISTDMSLISTSDGLGTINFQGADGTNFVSSVQIAAFATGTPASTRMAGILQIKTATDAAPSVMTLAVTIDSAQLATFAGGIALSDAKNIAVGTGTGTIIATTISQKIGVYGTAPIAQRAGAAQAAVATTGATNSTPFGFTTAAQADAIVTLVNELRAWAVAQGWIKGAA